MVKAIIMKKLLVITTLTIISLFALAKTLSFKEKLSNIQKNYELTGLASALFIDNKVIEMAASGKRKIEDSSELSSTDKFHLGSCTKAMTATLVATFVEEKKINWTDSLEKLLPHFKIHDDYKKVTIEDVLAHYGRFEKDPEDKLYYYLDTLSINEARKSLSEKVLSEKSPIEDGTGNYSNIGYILIGHILENLTGKSWETLMEERIFSPLGMSSCGFGPTSNPNDTIATSPWGHYIVEGKVISEHWDNSSFYGPSGSVHCNLVDWNKFLSAHIDGFNKLDTKILRAETYKKLHTKYPKNDEVYTYGAWNLLERDWAKGPVLTHTGSNVINFANVWVAPKLKAALMGVSNQGGDKAWEATNEAISELLNMHLKN